MIADLCEVVNLDYYLPQHADFNEKSTLDFVITNKIIANGDIEQLKSCNFVFAHIQSPIDEGVAGEISRYKTMQEYEPEQPSFHNQTIYLNQYCIGEIENSLGCYHTIGECFINMYKEFSKNLSKDS